MESQNKNGNIIAIITMMFLYAMISFVTNLAAPIGVIWKNVFADSGSANMIGMLGNAMNFLAYLFMGIPAGKLLTKIVTRKQPSLVLLLVLWVSSSSLFLVSSEPTSQDSLFISSVPSSQVSLFVSSTQW